ncbi:hypothetical protein ACFLZV_01525 [Candidatus Margulisiibacteriota bacterium]
MRKLIFFIVMVFFSAHTFAVQKHEVVDLLSELDAADYNKIFQGIETALETDAKDTGYVKINPFGGAGGFYFFFPGNGINTPKSSQAKSITNLYGGAGGFMFNFNKYLAGGFLFGGMGGKTSTKINSDFYEYSAGGFFQMALAKYKPIITEKFIVDIDLGLGVMFAGYENAKTDENYNGYEVKRSKSLQPCFLIGTDLRYRLNYFSFISLKAGYFYSKFDDLGRGDFSESGSSLEFSAPYLAVTWGGNF